MSKSTYSYTLPDAELPTTAVSTNTYSYGNENWPDQLTQYNGVTITYDEIGNPLSYYNGQNFTFTWEGRTLTSATSGENSYSYEYNSNGIRVKKVANSVVHNYTIDGTKILAETYGDTVLKFYYDENDSPIAFSVNGTMYYYGKNLQGDVVKLYTANGEVVAEYAYDAWGELIAITDANGATITDTASPAVVNPIRYRGYYYDAETGFYYLNSRYYDPDVGRFLNADELAFLGVSGTTLGYNLYGYCENEPVMNSDPSGLTPANIIGAVIVGVIGVVGGYFFTRWLADKIGLKGWKRTVFIAGLTAVITAAAAVIGYFVGPYVAKVWYALRAKISGLVRGLFKSIQNITSTKMNHINTSKHLWNNVLGKQTSNVNIKNLIYRAIRNGEWKVLDNGTIGIHWKYAGQLIEITGNVVNGVFKVGNAWVWDGISKLLF